MGLRRYIYVFVLNFIRIDIDRLGRVGVIVLWVLDFFFLVIYILGCFL